jgi:hypothetical protein
MPSIDLGPAGNPLCPVHQTPMAALKAEANLDNWQPHEHVHLGPTRPLRRPRR